jgi:hypothetical protein
MHDPVSELKARASILHARIRRGDTAAIVRMRALPEFRTRTDEELAVTAPSIQLRQSLSVIAAEFGFSGWQHATAILTGADAIDDFGTTLYPRGAGGHLNSWYRDYDAAAARRSEGGGFLLAYRRDFFVAEAPFVESLGLDPVAPQWARMGFDWARPQDVAARTELYGVLISIRPREEAVEMTIQNT